MRTSIRTYALTLLEGWIDTRLYPLHLPQAPRYPAVTYQLVSASTEQHLRGQSALRQARFQFDFWSPDAAEAWAMAEALRAGLDGYRGPAGDHFITTAWLALDQDNYEQGVQAYRVTHDYDVMYRSQQT